MKEIIDNLHLEVYGYGLVAEPGNVMRGWIEMEMPGAGLFPDGRHEKFYSTEASGRYEAMESVCDVAISQLCKEFFVLVKDVNFDEAKKYQQRAIDAECWCTLLQGVVEAMFIYEAICLRRIWTCAA